MDETHYQKGDAILTPFVILLTIHKSLAPDLVSSHWSKHLSKPCPVAYSGPSNVEHISRLSKWQRRICWFAESPKIQAVIVTLNLLSVFRYLVIRRYFPSSESVELIFFILAIFGDILLMADPVKNYLRRKTPLPQNDESSYMRRVTRSLANAGFRFQGVSEQQATEWERRWRSMDGILMEKFTIYNLEPPKEEETGMRCSVELSFFENGYVRLLEVGHLKDENDCVACALGNR